MGQVDWVRKPASLWSVGEIQALEQLEEGPYLEFKKPSEFFINNNFSLDTFTSEILETISAFLNSDGGVLLIGVQTTGLATEKRVEKLRPLNEWESKQTLEHLGTSSQSNWF